MTPICDRIKETPEGYRKTLGGNWMQIGAGLAWVELGLRQRRVASHQGDNRGSQSYILEEIQKSIQRSIQKSILKVGIDQNPEST
jgi:hypothetical protein